MALACGVLSLAACHAPNARDEGVVAPDEASNREARSATTGTSVAESPPPPPPPTPAPASRPYRIVVQNGSATFTDYFGGRILQARIPSGAPHALLEGLDRPFGIAVDGASIFWTSGGTSADNYRDGTVSLFDGHTKRALATKQQSPWGIVLDANNVYWTEREGGTVQKVPRSGGSVVTLATGQDHPVGIAVDASFVYFTTWGDGRVAKVPIAGGAVKTLATKQLGVEAIALDNDAVYWANTLGGEIVRLPKPDNALAQTLASAQGSPKCILVEPAYVYWCSNDAIVRVEKRGGPLLTVGALRPGVESMAVDAARIFSVDANTNAIVQGPK